MKCDPGTGLSVPSGSLPDLFGGLPVLRVRHDHVGRQAVRERADLSRRAAGARLAREAERPVAGLRLFAEEQVDRIDLLVHPGAARMLVKAHGPEAHYLPFLFNIEVRQLLQFLFELLDRLVRVPLRERGHEVERVRRQSLFEVLEPDEPVCVGRRRHASSRACPRP